MPKGETADAGAADGEGDGDPLFARHHISYELRGRLDHLDLYLGSPMSPVGQKAKSSERTDVFRSCSSNGHRQAAPVGPFRANKPDSDALLDHVAGGREGVSSIWRDDGFQCLPASPISRCLAVTGRRKVSAMRMAFTNASTGWWRGGP